MVDCADKEETGKKERSTLLILELAVLPFVINELYFVFRSNCDKQQQMQYRRITLMPAINIQQVPNESVWYYYQETTKRRSRTPQNEKSRPAFCIYTTKD